MKKFTLFTFCFSALSFFTCLSAQVALTIPGPCGGCNAACVSSGACSPEGTGDCSTPQTVSTTYTPPGSAGSVRVQVVSIICATPSGLDVGDVIQVAGTTYSAYSGNDAANINQCVLGNGDITVSLTANRRDETVQVTFTAYSSTNCSGAPLPIELSGFTVRLAAGTAHLRWQTATERNNAHFSIERSADGSTFTEIGRVTGKGNSSVKQDYTFTDERPLKGINYYRLRQVDFDGTAAYSPVASVVNGRTGGITVAPSPATDLLKVRFDEATEAAGRYEVFDQAGRLVLNGAVAEESNELNLEVAVLVPGIYILRMTNGQVVVTKRFGKE